MSGRKVLVFLALAAVAYCFRGPLMEQAGLLVASAGETSVETEVPLGKIGEVRHEKPKSSAHQLKEGEVEGRYKSFTALDAELDVAVALAEMREDREVHWIVPQLLNPHGIKRDHSEISVFCRRTVDSKGREILHWRLLVGHLETSERSIVGQTTRKFQMFTCGVSLSYCSYTRAYDVRVMDGHRYMDQAGQSS